MTDWSFKASDWKCLVYTSTSDVCSLFFVNCDVHHIKFIIYRKRRLKKVGGGGGWLVATPLLSAGFCNLTIRECGSNYQFRDDPFLFKDFGGFQGSETPIKHAQNLKLIGYSTTGT